jgi:hypothetical protein
MSQKRNPALGATGNGAGFGVRDAAEFSAELAESQGYRGAVLRKNMAEEIRIGLSEFNGHVLVNIRVWADPRNGGAERIPTKAGIACRVALLPELIAALQKAEAEARMRGLLS